jgi:CBS domain-containing protein
MNEIRASRRCFDIHAAFRRIPATRSPDCSAFVAVTGTGRESSARRHALAVDHRCEVLVVDLMAGDLVVVAPNVPVDVVAEMLADHDIGGLPVVDDAGRLVGVVSQTDLLRLGASSVPWAAWPALQVQDVMTQPAVTIRGSASLREAARAMTERGVSRLVVVGDDTETALGVISDSDLVRALGR